MITNAEGVTSSVVEEDFEDERECVVQLWKKILKGVYKMTILWKKIKKKIREVQATCFNMIVFCPFNTLSQMGNEQQTLLDNFWKAVFEF